MHRTESVIFIPFGDEDCHINPRTLAHIISKMVDLSNLPVQLIYSVQMQSNQKGDRGLRGSFTNL